MSRGEMAQTHVGRRAQLRLVTLRATRRSTVTPAKYDALAHVYDRRWRRYLEGTIRAALADLQLNGTERVLDMPIGTGEPAHRLLQNWPDLQLTGADYSQGMLQRARTKLPGAVRLTCCDAAALPFASESFDLVVCISSFHYFQTPAEALSEFRRVLRRGGRLLLLDWCDDYWACKLCSAWLRWTDPAFLRTYTRDACQAQLQRAGFRVVERRQFRIDRLWGMMRFVAQLEIEPIQSRARATLG